MTSIDQRRIKQVTLANGGWSFHSAPHRTIAD